MGFGAAVGGVLGGLFGLGGTAMQAAYNKKEAKRQRTWTAEQRATAYQTTMADMQAAGLNPLLAYKQGPTPIGAGSVASIGQPNIGGQAAAGSQAATAGKLREKQGNLARQQLSLVEAQANSAKATEAATLNMADKTAWETEAIKYGLANVMPHTARQAQHNAELLRWQIPGQRATGQLWEWGGAPAKAAVGVIGKIPSAKMWGAGLRTMRRQIGRKLVR